MFGWIKKAQINEQRKLVFQNRHAIPALKAYFESSNARELLPLLDGYEEETHRVSLLAMEQGILSPADLKVLFEINGELRKFYMQTSLRFIKAFDENYRPILGWKAFYKQDM
jgi:hypothetical protein